MDQNTQASQAKVTEGFTAEDIAKNKTMAIIAYILFFVPLLTESKDSPFAKFHVKQAIMLWIAGLAISMASMLIPIIGWFIIGPFGTIAVVVLAIMGLINATNGKATELPIIGKYAEQLLKF